MDLYKFGNYICKLREEKNLTQSELASILDVTDKSVSKWENGQAFPRIDTFEKLASALGTSVEDIFSASKDGITRVCFMNNFCDVMYLDVDGERYFINTDECKWIEFKSSSVIVKITGEFLTDTTMSEFEDVDAKLKDRIKQKLEKLEEKLVLQVGCTYKISDIVPDSIITVNRDKFDLGDKAVEYVDFIIAYPKVSCPESTSVELLDAQAQNLNKLKNSFSLLGFFDDVIYWGDIFGFFLMLLFYPLRRLYFSYLCSARVLKKNILNAENHKEKSKNREKYKKYGCSQATFILFSFLVVLLILSAFVFPVAFVSIDKPYLVAQDYSTITYKDSVYVRIEELPQKVHETRCFGSSVWMDSRTDGLSKKNQSKQNDKVKLYEDDYGKEYLWLVEDYNLVLFDENSEEKNYEDFEEHYVYVCDSPEETHLKIKKSIDIIISLVMNGEI